MFVACYTQGFFYSYKIRYVTSFLCEGIFKNNLKIQFNIFITQIFYPTQFIPFNVFSC